MLFEPIEIELDKKRKFKLNARRALLRAEQEINRRRRSAVAEWLSIDFLIFSAAKSTLRESGSFPLDLLMVLLWAGLVEAIADAGEVKITEGKPDPPVTVEMIPDLLEASPLTRTRILTLIWEYYLLVTTKPQTLELQ